jgi:hypothetical protein
MTAGEVSMKKRCRAPRWLVLFVVCLGLAGSSVTAARPALPRLAVFRADVTPPVGQPNAGNVASKEVIDPLWAKGIVLDDGGARYVLCAMDWCVLGGDADLLVRTAIAQAAGTDITRVALHTVHQHAAPVVFSLEQGPAPDPKRLRFSQSALEEIAGRVAEAAKASLGKFEPFDRIGTGQARVERVASARRLVSADGKPLTRWSESGKDPAMTAAPEGTIDPWLKTITFARGDKPLVRLHYYATHPQSFCCDGRTSADFVGWARETLEQRENVFQIYFTGCAGNVTVGKYNDASPAAREALGNRLLAAMSGSAAATRYSPVSRLVWRTVELTMPPRTDRTDRPRSPRTRPFTPSALEIGDISILGLPGEPMLEFQLYAQKFRPKRFVAVAECNDAASYICTDQMLREGGYEPQVTRFGPGAEGNLKEAIRQLLGEKP